MHCSVAEKEKRPPLRQYLLDGDFFIGSAVATNLTKLALKYAALEGIAPPTVNRMCSNVMLTMSSILHLGRSGFPTRQITNDDVDRIFVCLRTLSARSEPEVVAVFASACRTALARMLDAQHEEEQQEQRDKRSKAVRVQADDPIVFAQLSSERNNLLGENLFETSLNQALAGTKCKLGLFFRVFGSVNNVYMLFVWTCAATAIADIASPNSKLNKVTQLTGFSDPVYAEAYVHVNQYDIVLDVLIVNQTADTLQNCTLELATLGDLKLVERPHPVVLAPHDFCNIKANVKVSSTENGIIFGNIGEEVAYVSNHTQKLNVFVFDCPPFSLRRIDNDQRRRPQHHSH